MIGITFALAAAIFWGASDFCGGFASRKLNQFQVLLLTTVSSLLLLILFALIWREGLPSAGNIIIAVIAGISGSIGLAALYKGLSLGNSALVSPIAGVIGAIIPTLTGLFIEGLPSFWKLIGFVLSIVGIWLVTRSGDESEHTNQKGLGLALLAGVGFGGFLALIAQIEGEQVFTPLIFSKLAAIFLITVLISIRQLPIPKPIGSPIAILTGFVDTGGNVLYFLATQFARIDVAALLSSLYPAGTVLLSSLILKEELSIRQWIGVSTCIAAIMLITSG